MRSMRTWCWALIGWSLTALVAEAQGVLIVVAPEPPPLPRPHPWPHPWPHPRPAPPQPVMSYKIKELSMQAKIVDQVAQVEVSQSFVNTGSQQMEVQFVFPLPYDGAIDRMTLLVDGKEFPAKLQDAKAARSTYEAIVRSNRDPALLEWVGTGMFQTSVFPVPAGAERKVSLRYSQLCRQDKGLTELLFPLSTAKYTSHPVETVSLQVAIESAHDIKNVYSPTHAIDVQRPDGKHAIVKYTSKDQVPSSDFRLFYDVGDGALSTRVISYRPSEGEDGYFLLLGSPKIESGDKAPPAKTVVFVVDKSGSMSGEKIEQAKSALKFVLNNLRPEDTFNIVAYDSEVVSFRPELEKFNDETRNAAIGFVNGIYAGGGTNIDGALSTALSQLKDSNRPTYVLFMTDGLPTVGETNEMKITENVKTKNGVRARIISFGVGYDLNSRLLDRLSRANYGQSEFVRPNENIEVAVSKLYAKISTPVLSRVSIKYEYDAKLDPAAGEPINRVYPKEVHDVFAGGQIVVVGR
ncbi:MAG TPA: VIT domain-containing protein, partial [Pirellulales bacterium]